MWQEVGYVTASGWVWEVGAEGTEEIEMAALEEDCQGFLAGWRDKGLLKKKCISVRILCGAYGNRGK